MGLCAGALPGPIILGYVMDRSCLLWKRKCDDSTGACLYYDNYEMAWLLFAVSTGCKALCTVFGLLGWRMYVGKQRSQKSELETENKLDSQPQSTTSM